MVLRLLIEWKLVADWKLLLRVMLLADVMEVERGGVNGSLRGVFLVH